jgi:hypothetical protein
MLPRCADDEGDREVVLLTDGCVGFVSLPPSRSREIDFDHVACCRSAPHPSRYRIADRRRRTGKPTQRPDAVLVDQRRWSTPVGFRPRVDRIGD